MLTVEPRRALWRDDEGWTVRVTATEHVESEWSGRLCRAWNVTITDASGVEIYRTRRDRSDTVRSWGGSREVLGAALGFLGADAERYRYHGPDPDDGDGFSYGATVAEWADQHDDALTMARLEIEGDED